MMNFQVKIGRVLPLLLLALSAGCTTLKEKECRSIDWHEQGRVDGAEGYEATRRGDHSSACRRYGVAPDMDAYRAGREEGLSQYCTSANALQQGMKGAPYRQVCTGDVGQQFSVVYARGKALNLILNDMQTMQHRFDEERDAQADVKDPDLYKQIDQNLRYFEHEKAFMQLEYNQARFTVNSGFDPPFYDDGGWRAGIPFPKALRAAKR